MKRKSKHSIAIVVAFMLKNIANDAMNQSKIVIRNGCIQDDITLSIVWNEKPNEMFYGSVPINCSFPFLFFVEYEHINGSNLKSLLR